MYITVPTKVKLVHTKEGYSAHEW